VLKSLPAALVVVILAAACVNVAPQSSTTPPPVVSAAPSLGVTTPAPITQPPTVSPTIAPTVAPTLPPPPTVAPTATATPTQATTPAPTSAPSVGPTTGPSGSPPADQQLFSDDMSDPTSGWQTTNENFATITYDTGVLAFRFNNSQSWAYTVRPLDRPSTTLVLEADFQPQSAGIFGPMCGDSNTTSYYGAVVTDGGGLVFLESDSGKVNVLERHDDLKLDVTLGASNPMAIECSADSDGNVQIVAGLSGTGPVAVYRATGTNVHSFDVATLYGEATSDGYTLAVDSAAAWGVDNSTGTMSDGASTLLTHIPTDFQKNCYESPIWNTSAQFEVTCMLQTSGTGAEILQLQQYADTDGMNAAYQALVSAFRVDSTGSCESGPNEAQWTVNEQTGGRVLCAPQKVGIRFDWTDDASGILSSLIDLDGSYKDTFGQWQDAGPV
jgi:hypothetical protein